MTDTQKKYLKFLLKLLLTSAALYFVFQKIPFDSIWEQVKGAHPLLLLVAFLAYNLSKIIAGFRTATFYTALGLWLPAQYHLRLYYVGMFYNLFLPGSIGGDGYKVFLLQQQLKNKTKQLVGATLLDRLSGLAALGVLTCGLLAILSWPEELYWANALAFVAMLLVIPAFYLLNRWFFPLFLSTFWRTLLLSFGVQGVQLGCAWVLLLALGVETQWLAYMALFLLSSVVSVLPFTVGGVGAREIVFLYGTQWMALQESTAIAFSLLFFLLTAFSSLIGLAFLFSIDRKPVIAEA